MTMSACRLPIIRPNTSEDMLLKTSKLSLQPGKFTKRTGPSTRSSVSRQWSTSPARPRTGTRGLRPTGYSSNSAAARCASAGARRSRSMAGPISRPVARRATSPRVGLMDSGPREICLTPARCCLRASLGSTWCILRGSRTITCIRCAHGCGICAATRPILMPS